MRSSTDTAALLVADLSGAGNDGMIVANDDATITVIGGLNFVTLDGSIVAAGDFDGDGRADLAGAGGIGLSIMPKVCVRSADLIP